MIVSHRHWRSNAALLTHHLPPLHLHPYPFPTLAPTHIPTFQAHLPARPNRQPSFGAGGVGPQATGLAPASSSCPLSPPSLPPSHGVPPPPFFPGLFPLDSGARCWRGRRRCGPGAAGVADPVGPGAGGRDKNTWWQHHVYEQALFPECSAGTQQEISDLSMTCPWLIHDLSMTYPWLVHDLSMTYPWLVHDLSKTCPWLVHDLSMTCPWLVQKGYPYILIYPYISIFIKSYPTNLSQTCEYIKISG